MAGADAYEDRFAGPFGAALPWAPPDLHPQLFALPGNHDWYDGLTSFMRVFCQGKWIGGWKTEQARSYFAVQLPHRWWLWAIDIQFDTYVDEPQLRYFEDIAAGLRRGDRVILCTAKPSWVDVAEDRRAFRNLAYVERKLIRPTGARLLLTLSGDSHHYARYEGPDGTHKVTAGGGGAFLHPTHVLPRKVAIEVDPHEGSPVAFERKACYPDPAASRRLLLGCPALPLRNPAFMFVPAAVHVLLLWANQFGIRTLARRGSPSLEAAAERFGIRDLAAGLFREPTAVLLIGGFAAFLVAFAKPPPRLAHTRWPRLAAKLLLGLVHTALQLAAVVVVAWAAVAVVSRFADGAWFAVWLFVLVAALGGLAGGVVMGAYLAACNALPGVGSHGNEAFSAMRLTRCKNFLRLHIDREGVLRVYAIGVDAVAKRWRPDPDADDPGASWLVPAGAPPQPRLLEEPLVIGGRSGRRRRSRAE